MKVYEVVYASTCTSLIQQVNGLLSDGWVCVGGVSFHADLFWQALQKDVSH